MRRVRRLLAVAFALLAIHPAPLAAATRIAAPDALVCTGVAPSTARRWPVPLDRPVSLVIEDVSLGTALERLATAASLRLSYSADLLPLARRVCLTAHGLSAGEALRHLLAGTGIVPIVAGDAQVVLAPARDASATADAAPLVARTARQLDRVIVTGTATGAPERGSPFAVSVLEGHVLSRDGSQALATLTGGSVPGLWLWAQSPTSLLARYGSVRGASSFGASAPKVYIDGIEVANPLVVTHLDPASVQRIEVIRGPQGAALFGADAIGGVVQIVTRQDGVSAALRPLEIRAGLGASGSAFAGAPVLAQEHGVRLRAGSSARAATLATSVTTLGAFIPGASARQLLVQGNAKRVGTRSVLTGTARYFDNLTHAPGSPVVGELALATSGTPLGGDSVSRESVRHYTLGATVVHHASARWTHAATAGLDGYRLDGVSSDGLPYPSASDSALQAARGGADRATLRLSGTRRSGSPGARHSLTVAFEHSSARERTNGAVTLLAPRAGLPVPGGVRPDSTSATIPPAALVWWQSSGVLAEGQLAWGTRAYVTAGLRAEHVRAPSRVSRIALLPMIGGAWVEQRGALALKSRVAYGRGIRAARTVSRGGTWSGGMSVTAPTALDPETQSGTEVGADLLWEPQAPWRVGVHVTRFDQRASGLVQPVALFDSLPTRVGAAPRGRVERRVRYELQNVGAIDNSGWELQGAATLGALELNATLTLVESRVARLAMGYLGDLRRGDRMLEVPARTLGFAAAWQHARGSIGLSAARAADWINYDRLALADAYARANTPTVAGSPSPPRPPVGAQLRSYWRSYDGPTRLGARGTLSLARGLSLSLAGENLLNRQTGEPDNVTVVPGRTLLGSVRVAF